MQLALVLILIHIESKDLEGIKGSLCSLYTDVKLQECALNLPEEFFPITQTLSSIANSLGTIRLARHPPWLKNMLLQIRNHIVLIRDRISSIPMRALLTKVPDNKETSEDKNKEKVQRIQRKRHGRRVRRIRLKQINLNAVHVVSIDGAMTMGMGILCGKI